MSFFFRRRCSSFNMCRPHDFLQRPVLGTCDPRDFNAPYPLRNAHWFYPSHTSRLNIFCFFLSDFGGVGWQRGFPLSCLSSPLFFLFFPRRFWPFLQSSRLDIFFFFFGCMRRGRVCCSVFVPRVGCQTRFPFSCQHSPLFFIFLHRGSGSF